MDTIRVQKFTKIQHDRAPESMTHFATGGWRLRVSQPGPSTSPSPYAKIVLIPKRLGGLLVFLGLLLLMFLCGMALGCAAIGLSKGPRLMGWKDLIGIPAALIAGWMTIRLSRQLFRRDFQGTSRIRVFSSPGVSAWFVSVLLVLPFAAGLWFCGGAGVFEREPQFVQARTPAPTPAPVPPSKPTPPAGTMVVARESGLRLSGVFYGASRPSAIIDGQTVFVGDRVGYWAVQEIGPGTVTVLSPGGATDTLVLKHR